MSNSCLVFCPHESLFLPLPVACFFILAPVMLLFPLGQTYRQFDASADIMQIQGHQRISLLRSFTNQLLDLVRMQKQLARSSGFGADVRGCRWECAYMRTDKENFPIPDNDVSFLQLRPTGPDCLGLPALQYEAGLIAIFDEVIVKCFFVLRNAHGGYLTDLLEWTPGLLSWRTCVPHPPERTEGAEGTLEGVPLILQVHDGHG